MSDQPSTTSSAGGLGYIGGLDGIRAVSVIAVLLFHAGLPVSGGYLGVESFFVLSGFLITALLAAEWSARGSVDLAAFWLRRARRLLPALLLLFAGVGLLGLAVLHGERTALGGDTLASLGYVMNWRLILSGQSYFDPLVRPSLLQHLWSLAVEEQFYLVWPLVFVAGMRLLRRRGLLALTVVAALASLGLMAWLYRPGADPSRIYYGTDTRAGGVLLGAALALAWTPATSTRRWARLADGAGLLALVGLLACFGWLSNRSQWLYPGGFVLVDALTLALVVAAAQPHGQMMPRLLGWAPLRWIGLRSYGLYLWHWPVFQVTRPYSDLPLGGVPLLLLRLAITAVLVELSYRLVELPVRHGALGRAWQRWRERGPQASPAGGARWASFVLPLLLIVGIGSVGLDRPARVAVRRLPTPTPVSIPVAAPAPTSAASTPPTSSAAGVATERPAPAGPTTAPTVTPTAAPPQPFDPALAAELQSVLDEAVASGAIPGAELSVSIPGYEPWTGASGAADRTPERAMEPGTPLHISSITKMFTAVVVLQLAAEGKVDLDAPIATWLPDIVPLAERTTPRQLMSHTSGLFDYLEDSRFFIEAYQNPERTYTPAELVEMVDGFGAAFEPGTAEAWKYSSTNYVILGMLVEQVTGRPLRDEMHARIFEPLGLADTYFAPQDDVPAGIAQGYIGASDRADVSMTFVFGTGNLISTAADMRRFAEGLFGGRLLSPAALAEMERFSYTGGAYDMPELEYGLGLMRARLQVGPRADGVERSDDLSVVEGHIGGIAGCRTALWRVSGTGVTIALGMNQAEVDPNILARDTLAAILEWQGQ